MRRLPALTGVLAAAAILAGCAIHPEILPDRATALRMADERRTLPVEERYRHQGAGDELSAGNEVALLVDGPANFAAMIEAVGHASEQVDVETYIFEPDGIGEQLIEALERKARAGVRVNLIYDGIGSMGTAREVFARLEAVGMRVCEFNPPNPLRAKGSWSLNHRDHRKILIVDGHTAFTGGLNISGVYSSSSSPGADARRVDGEEGEGADPPWRDSGVRLRGPAVAHLQQLFAQTWASQGCGNYTPLAERDPLPAEPDAVRREVRIVASGPKSNRASNYAVLRSAVVLATDRIWLTTAYFAPDDALVEDLRDAARRGVDVRLLLPGPTDAAILRWVAQARYAELIAGGVRVFERQDALLHAKTAVIDGYWLSVGTANIDYRSFLHNDELSVIVIDRSLGREMEALFESDLASSVEIREEDVAARGALDRFKGWFSRLWEYWL
jgi:cardiolipin synthase